LDQNFGKKIIEEIELSKLSSSKKHLKNKEIFRPILLSFRFISTSENSLEKIEHKNRWKNRENFQMKKSQKTFSPTSERGSVRCRKSKVPENQ
jgi:hypothetical protein